METGNKNKQTSLEEKSTHDTYFTLLDEALNEDAEPEEKEYI